MTYPKNRRMLVLLLALVLLAGGITALGSTFATRVKDSEGEGVPLGDGKDFYVTVNYHDGSGYNTELMNKPTFVEDALWCPGKTEIVYLAVTNYENFPVKCTLSMNVSKNEFDDMLKYAVIDENLKADNTNHPANWAAFEKDAEGSHILKKSTDTETNNVFEGVTLNIEETRYFALAIHMDESATSIYQNKLLDMTFNLRVNAEYEPGYSLDPSKQ